MHARGLEGATETEAYQLLETQHACRHELCSRKTEFMTTLLGFPGNRALLENCE